MEVLDEALSEILKHALVVHAHGVGEPTLHPKFCELLHRLTHYGVLVDFFTNGMNLTDEILDAIFTSNLSDITFSISGSTKREYENVYWGGKFDFFAMRFL